MRSSATKYVNGVKVPVTSHDITSAANDATKTPRAHHVSKYTLIKRLEAAGKFTQALAALRSDDLLYEKWSAVNTIKSDDQPTRELLTDIGLDPDIIFKPE